MVNWHGTAWWKAETKSDRFARPQDTKFSWLYTAINRATLPPVTFF
jgi:hypothetical protein